MIDSDEPLAGHYRMRFTRGGPLVGIRLWHGQPLDPDTGELMDRSYRWNAQANGESVELDRVWPQCAGDPIPETEYEFLRQRTEWARKNDAYDPLANPRRKTNWDDSTVPSFGD